MNIRAEPGAGPSQAGLTPPTAGPGRRPEGASEPIPAAVLQALRGFGLLEADETPRFEPLTGGVSSDILKVTTARGAFCIKRALPRLKVAAVWEAPVARNACEAAWLRAVGIWLPDAVPAVLGEDPTLGLFAMQWLSPQSHPLWKQQLLNGEVDQAFARDVGQTLAQIHARAAGCADIAAQFANRDIFEPIRIEPYLRATALRHPDLAAPLNRLADTTLATGKTLIHGDISPKNILKGPRGPVFLDAECACYGDPAFDLAFCLNHLLLKGRYRLQAQPALLQAFAALAEAYLERVDWEDRAAFERRTAHLLPALLLARIDGKSPVEYLTDEAERDTVRQVARRLLRNPVDRLARVAEATRYWRPAGPTAAATAAGSRRK